MQNSNTIAHTQATPTTASNPGFRTSEQRGPPEGGVRLLEAEFAHRERFRINTEAWLLLLLLLLLLLVPVFISDTVCAINYGAAYAAAGHGQRAGRCGKSGATVASTCRHSSFKNQESRIKPFH
ncbi:hypothetical protein FIBSPDRAFT_964182 [Athelia psychrophila]|uniref:Uncharacterized protein n=1 Tax=Athelia psychrophila TaxID=1759441 RepID=A0A165Y3L0_9AGAM|nr:hypothetical protein FIBSPDRAFT_964182 [Fibularhizoctonia sp. CBS 109695]